MKQAAEEMNDTILIQIVAEGAFIKGYLQFMTSSVIMDF